MITLSTQRISRKFYSWFCQLQDYIASWHTLQWITSQQLYVQLTSWIFYACHASSQTRWAKSIYVTKKLTLSEPNHLDYFSRNLQSHTRTQIKFDRLCGTCWKKLQVWSWTRCKVDKPINTSFPPSFMNLRVFYQPICSHYESLWPDFSIYLYFFVSMNKSFINKATYFVKL